MQTTTDAPKKISLYGVDTSAFTFDGHAMSKNADGTSRVTRMPVFKAGTFRDSWGDQQTWTQDHLRQMVDNFSLLKARDIFPNVPVRSDHSFSIDKVIGYVDGLSLSEDGNFLLADYTVTEPTAAEKIARGTYRSRSLEVGMFETNSGEMYYPVVFGFAFVDIPAVEGLHSKKSGVAFFSMSMDEGGVWTPRQAAQYKADEDLVEVFGKYDQGVGPDGAHYVAASPFPEFKCANCAFFDGARQCEIVAGDIAPEGVCKRWIIPASLVGSTQSNNSKETHMTKPTDDRGASKPEATASVLNSATNTFGTSATSSGTLTLTTAPAVRKFRINGQEVEAGDAVQAHIDALEAFAKETRDGNRRNFVSALAESKKIAATQVEALTALAADMSDEQFEAFKSAYEAAPVLSILAEHGGSNTNLDGETIENDELVILRETVAQHRRAGLTEAQIAQTASFKKLTALTASKN